MISKRLTTSTISTFAICLKYN